MRIKDCKKNACDSKTKLLIATEIFGRLCLSMIATIRNVRNFCISIFDLFAETGL